MRVFELGALNHRIVWGDCTSPEVQNALWGGQGEQAIDLVVTDPPYGVKLHKPSCRLAHPIYAQKIANDDREIDDLLAWERQIVVPLMEHSKGAAWYVFVPWGYITDNIIFYRELGFGNDQLLTWIKNGFSLTRKEYQYQTEQILFLSNGTLKHRNKLRTNSTAIFGPAPMSLRRGSAHRELHPCAKPIELLERFILNHSKKGETVCDPFIGGGSTLVACERTGRRCIGAELSGKYLSYLFRGFWMFSEKEPIFELVAGERIPRTLEEIENILLTE